MGIRQRSISDEEFISRLARQEERRTRVKVPLGTIMVAVGLIMTVWSSYRMTHDINGHLAFLREITSDMRPLQRDPAEVAARIGYGHGVVAGLGLSATVGGGLSMVC